MFNYDISFLQQCCLLFNCVTLVCYIKLWTNIFDSINKLTVAEVEPVVKNTFETPDDPLINFTVNDVNYTVNNAQMTSIVDSLVEENNLGVLNLLICRISHEEHFLNNNESVLKARALIAFDKEEFRLVILIKTLIVTYHTKLNFS